MKLLVFVVTGEELGSLATLLQACAAKLIDLELVFSEDLQTAARLSYPAPRLWIHYFRAAKTRKLLFNKSTATGTSIRMWRDAHSEKFGRWHAAGMLL